MKRRSNGKASVFDKLRPSVVIGVSAVLLALFSAAVSFFTENLLYLTLGISFLLLECALFWAFGILSTRRRSHRGERLSLISTPTLDFLADLAQPATVLSEDGRILWHNASFEAAVPEEKQGLQMLEELTDEPVALTRLIQEESDELALSPVEAHLSGIKYELVSYRIIGEGRTCLVVLWTSQERAQELEALLADRNAVVSYIAVDNYAEAAGFLQGNYRTIAAKISILLKEWAEEMNGILQEVDSDRYILIMEEKHLAGVKEKRFDILDRVRELSEGDVEIPVTISVGCACVSGTMQQKENAAHQALDLALQRGGDQAVLKMWDNATEYYGGKTKTVQKRTKIRSRIVASRVENLLKEASNVLIMGHRFADHDSIGSGIGMARFAMHYCDRVNIVVNVHDSNLKGVFQKLGGLADYKNIFIDGPTAQDMISSSTLLIITDVNNTRQFEAPELFENISKVVIIDHHRQSAEFMVKPTVTYIEPSASSASELVAEMLEQQLPPGSLLKEEAELLFAGIILDTKQFTNNTGPRTFSAAHFLRSEGGSPAEAQMLFRSELEDFKREIKYEANAFIYRDIIAFSYIEENATQDDKIAASKAADRLLTLDGVLASFVLCRMDDTVHISARSSGTVNVQLITENLGGGGHFDMAGAQVRGSTIKEAFVRLKEVIDTYLNEA